MANAIVIAYFTLQLIGLVTLPLLTITFLLPFTNVRRHSTITNFTVLSTAFVIIACLLLFTRRLTGPEPPRVLCQAQAALMFGGPPALATSTLGFVLKVWHMAWSLDKQRTLTFTHEKTTTAILLLAPYLVWVVIAGISAGIGHNEVYRYTLYCTSAKRSLGILSGVSTAVILFITCCAQGWAIIIVYKRYRRSNRFRPAEIGEIDCALFIRICVFSCFILGMMVLSVIAAAMNWSLEICDIIASTVYLATFCVFASQSDVLEAWGIKSRSRAVDAENQSTEYPGTEYNAASSRICGRKLRFFTPKRVAEPTNGGFTSNNPEVLRTLNQSDGELPLDSKPTSHFRVANNSTDRAEEPSKSDRLEITRSPFSFKGSHSSMRPRSTSGVSAISDGSSSSLDHRGPPKFSVTHLPPEPDKSKSIKEIDEDEDEEAMEFSPSHEWETGYTHSFDSPIQTRISLHQAHNVWHNPS